MTLSYGCGLVGDHPQWVKPSPKGPYYSGNYSALLWSNKVSFLLWEGLQPNISMISEFVGPVGPLIYGLEYAKLLQTYRKMMESFRKILFV